MIDLKALAIKPGVLVNCVFVDIDILNMDGNIFDAAFLAAVLSIATARYDKKIVGEDGKEEVQKVPLPIRLIPVSITSITIGDNIMIDPTEEEDSILDSRMTVTFDEEGRLCAGQKGGSVGLSTEQLFKIIGVSKAKAEEIRMMIKKVIESA